MKKRLLKFLTVTMVLLMVLSLCAVAFAKSKKGGSSSQSSNNSASNNTAVSAANGNSVTGKDAADLYNQTNAVYADPTKHTIGASVTEQGATVKYSDGTTAYIPSDGWSENNHSWWGYWSSIGGDSGGGGGGGSSYSPPPPPSVDLNVSSITPLVGYRSAVGTTLVKVHNTSTAAQSNVVVRFEVNGTTQDKTVAIAANKDRTVIFTWNTPDAASATVKVTIDPSNAISETNEGNNTLSETITLLSIPDKADPKDQPENPVPIDEVPTNVTDPDTTWTEVDETGAEKTYTASLTVTASADQSQMKSGYGFKLNVKTDISTTGKAETITKPQYVLMYVPEFRYGSAVRLESTDGINWQLPVNTESVISARRWYVPVWYPDQAYNAYILVLGANTPGGMLSASTVVPITIQGNMYEDDVTTSWVA